MENWKFLCRIVGNFHQLSKIFKVPHIVFQSIYTIRNIVTWQIVTQCKLTQQWESHVIVVGILEEKLKYKKHCIQSCEKDVLFVVSLTFLLLLLFLLLAQICKCIIIILLLLSSPSLTLSSITYKKLYHNGCSDFSFNLTIEIKRKIAFSFCHFFSLFFFFCRNLRKIIIIIMILARGLCSIVNLMRKMFILFVNVCRHINLKRKSLLAY